MPNITLNIAGPSSIVIISDDGALLRRTIVGDDIVDEAINVDSLPTIGQSSKKKAKHGVRLKDQ